VEAGRRVSIFKIDPGSGKRLNLLATATVGEAGWTEPFDPSIYEEEGEESESIELERQDNLRRVANEILLIERAKELLLEGTDS
jgi:hypothetical protein